MKTSTIKQVASVVLFAATFFPLLLFGQVSHTVNFNPSHFTFGKQDSFDVVRGTELSSGIYIYKLTAAKFVSVKEMLMLK